MQIGEVHLDLKAGPSLTKSEGKPDRIRPSSWLSASPNFRQTRFGEIKIYEANFDWGPYWTSEGSLHLATGLLKRTLGKWTLHLANGTLSQNWLRDLRMTPGTKMTVELEGEDKLSITGGQFELGTAGKVTLDGHVQLGETPEFNFQLSMKTINLDDILPDQYQATLGGIADFELQVTGSPNRSDGIIFEGEMLMVEGGRIREVPILRTLSVITPRSEMRNMPIRSGSRVKFKSRHGLLTVSALGIHGGGAAVGVSGFKRSDGEILDYARVTGSFTYQMDTSELDKSLKLDSIRQPIEEDLTEEGPEPGLQRRGADCDALGTPRQGTLV